MTDPAHPLYGRGFVLLSVTRSPHASSCVFVAGEGDAVLKIPIRATSLHPAPRPVLSKLSLAAIRGLVHLAARWDGHGRRGRAMNEILPRRDATTSPARRRRPLGGKP